jgi:hypothetical protein
MKGYLLKEETIIIGEECHFESQASDAHYVVIFEDDGETGYFYAGEKDPSTETLSIVDMVFIYDVESIPEQEKKSRLSIIWSTDWQRAALVIGDVCHAVFDFENRGGYNLAQFPPPHLWTGHERKLTREMVSAFFK